MWAHDVDLPAYAAKLDEIEAELTGTATVEDGIIT